MYVLTKKELANRIEHTLLKGEATENEIEQLCQEAIDNSFYAVCVNPSMVKVARRYLNAHKSAVKVVAVVGFPLGVAPISFKHTETRYAIEEGADEIDLVVNLAAEKKLDLDYLRKEMSTIASAARIAGVPVKAIMETAILTPEEIVKCGRVLVNAGAFMLKTSTGYHKAGGATVEAVKLLKKVCYEVKASGGIRTALDALKMIKAGATRIGTSNGVAIIKSFSRRMEMLVKLYRNGKIKKLDKKNFRLPLEALKYGITPELVVEVLGAV